MSKDDFAFFQPLWLNVAGVGRKFNHVVQSGERE